MLAVFIVLAPACSKYDVELERAEEIAGIENWLEVTYDVLAEDIITESSIYYMHGKTGIGTSVTDTDAGIVELAFDAYVLKNNKLTLFYSYTREAPFVYDPEVPLIPGFYSGISIMRVGDTSTFIVPFDLGYGAADNGPIPGFSTLVFKINYITVILNEE